MGLNRQAARTAHSKPVAGHGLRSDCPARHRRPRPGPGSRCGRGTRSAPEGQFSRPRGLPPSGRAAPGQRLRARESHRGAPGHDRAPGPVQASHHRGQAGNHGQHKSHLARRAPHGVRRRAGPAQRRVLAGHNRAAHNLAGCHRACARSPGPHRLARGLSLPARAPGRACAPDRPAAGPARVHDPDRLRDPDPAQDRAVRAGGPPDSYACPRLSPFPVPDQGLPHPARRAGRSRTSRLARRGGRSRGCRWPVNRPGRNRLPSHQGRPAGGVLTRLGRPVGRGRGLHPPGRPHGRNPRLPPPGRSRVRTPPAARADHNWPLHNRAHHDRARPHSGMREERCRALGLRRAFPGCPAGLGNLRPGSPAAAGPAPSRGTAVAGTHAGAGRPGTRVRDRRSHAPAAHAAVPAGPRRSFVPLPCL